MNKHTEYYLGGPMDLTKKMQPGLPSDVVRMPIYNEKRIPVLSTAVYHLAYRLQDAINAYVYEFKEETPTDE